MSAPRVLIIDDDTWNIEVAEIVLTQEGFRVESATDGAQGLQRVALFQPDLILMDIQMPGRDGLELMRMLKADPTTRSLRIVAFTALAMRGDEAKFRAAGFDGYLSKPIDVIKFGAQVRALLQAPPDHAGARSTPTG